MAFHLVISLEGEKYKITAFNPSNEAEWLLFEHKDWDTINAQADYLHQLFGGCEVRRDKSLN